MIIEELLVVLACMTNQGCQDTSSHYYATHPELKEIVSHTEEKAKQVTDPVFIQTVGPMIYVVVGGTGTITLNKNFSLQFNKSNETLTYKWEF